VTVDDPIQHGDDRLDAMLSQLSTLANNPTPRKVGGSEGRRRGLVLGAVGVLLLGGVGIWQLTKSDKTEITAAGGAGSDASTPETDPSDSVPAVPVPDDTVAITLSVEPAPSSAAPSTTPSTAASTSSTAQSTTTLAPTTTAAPTTSTTSASSASPEVLTGIPTENLPGGQPWPNGLYQDDILYIRGTLPSKEISDQLEARVVAILGREFVVNEVQIDPTVPMVETVLLRLGNSVLFKAGDFDIPQVSELGFQLWAVFLAANPDVQVTIIGHTDNVGSEQYNIDLATRRALVARDQIGKTDESVLDRVHVAGVGPSDPIATNDTPEGRQLNRRVEFAVTGLFDNTN
jgi:outer membrane protein OmpA-like peptidoglycan-associated protein